MMNYGLGVTPLASCQSPTETGKEQGEVTAPKTLTSVAVVPARPRWVNLAKFCGLWLLGIGTLSIAFIFYSHETRNFLLPAALESAFRPLRTLFGGPSSASTRKPKDFPPALSLPHVSPPGSPLSSAPSSSTSGTPTPDAPLSHVQPSDFSWKPHMMALTPEVARHQAEEILDVLEKSPQAVGIGVDGRRNFTDLCKVLGGDLLDRFEALETAGRVSLLSIFDVGNLEREILQKEHPDMEWREISDLYLRSELPPKEMAALWDKYFASGNLSRDRTLFRNSVETFVGNNLQNNPLAVGFIGCCAPVFLQYVGVHYDKKSDDEEDWSDEVGELLDAPDSEVIYIGTSHCPRLQKCIQLLTQGLRRDEFEPDWTRHYGPNPQQTILRKPWVSAGKLLPAPDQAIRTAQFWLTRFEAENRPGMQISYVDFARVLVQLSRCPEQNGLFERLKDLYKKMPPVESKPVSCASPALCQLCCPPRLSNAALEKFAQIMKMLNSQKFTPNPGSFCFTNEEYERI
jgi:hypothetical protein